MNLQPRAFSGLLTVVLLVLFPLLLFPLLPPATLAGDPPAIQLRLLENGVAVKADHVRCALVSADQEDVLAKFEGLTYAGPKAPAVGDRLYLYARGFDLHQQALTEVPCSLDVHLVRAKDQVEIAIQVADSRPLDCRLGVGTQLLGPWERGPLSDWQNFEAGRGPISLTVPRGMELDIFLDSPQGVFLPTSFRGNAGQRIVVRFQRDVEVPLEFRLLRQKHTSFEFECVPDYLSQPEGSPEFIDVLKRAASRPSDLQERVTQQPDIFRFHPSVPFHLFAQFDDLPLYRRVDPTGGPIDLDRSPPLKRIAGRPLEAGKPLPAGTCLAPGRHDLVSMSTLYDLRQIFPGCSLILKSPQETWGTRLLPAADTLTAWHRDVGLIHMDWNESKVPSGLRHAGRAQIDLAPGRRAKGSVSVFNIWKGTGKFRNVPPEAPLRKRFTEETHSLSFPGLPPGAYSFYMEISFTDGTPGLSKGRRGAHDFVISEEEPLAHLVIGSS